MNRIAIRAPLGALLAVASTAALADHMGASAYGSGGGMSVFSPDTLDGGHWAAGLRFAYTRPEQRSDEELAQLAGKHIHAHNSDYNLNASLGLAYGVSHHLTLSLELPYVRRDQLREGAHSHVDGEAVNGVERLGTVAGIGDVNLLAKYRLTESEGAGFALIGGIKLPTGSTRRRSPEGERLETEHQPGSGSWDPIFGASASAPLGRVRLTASALYQLSTTGAQHTRLGNRLQGGIAISHRFGAPEPEHHHEERESGEHHHHHDAEVRHDSWDGFVELAGEWEGRQRTAGEVEAASGGKWVWLAPGVRFNSAHGWSAAAGVAVPVWQRIRKSHPNNRYRLMVSLGRAF
jgi:hypothetical protein